MGAPCILKNPNLRIRVKYCQKMDYIFSLTYSWYSVPYSLLPGKDLDEGHGGKGLLKTPAQFRIALHGVVAQDVGFFGHVTGYEPGDRQGEGHGYGAAPPWEKKKTPSRMSMNPS